MPYTLSRLEREDVDLNERRRTTLLPLTLDAGVAVVAGGDNNGGGGGGVAAWTPARVTCSV